jgi:penicillin-binding protein 1C
MNRRILFAALIILLGAATGLVVRAWLFVDLPSLETLPERLAAPSSEILDRNGQLLYQVIDPNGGGHTPVPLSEIPLACQQATIAVEDANYYRHPGVDLVGIARAIWINLRGRETLAGGSTITQQVARNLLLDPEEAAERSLTRKLRESILAWRLAHTYSKEEVLALYLNQSFYGNLAYGIEAAAQAYFGKPAGALDLAECAMLAGLPQAPALFNPLTNPAEADKKQALVLDLMVKENYVTSGEGERAKEEDLTYAAAPFAIEAPHFVTHVWGELQTRLGDDVIRAGGLVVTTTLDLDLQRAAEGILRRHLTRLATPTADRPARNVHNGGIVAVDPHSGEVLVMVGSPDYFDARVDGAVNAALAPRQPGSALKPFTYAAAFDPRRPDPWNPATVLLDVRSAFPTREGDPYVPLNYDRRYHGPVPVRQALASSYNVPAVKALQHVGLNALITLARDLGITTFADINRYGLALTLGGGEVRLLELTAAYGALANGGARVDPVAIGEVRRDGEVLLRHRSLAPVAVLDPRVAWLITDILSDDAARAPSFGRGSVLRLSRPAAVKTGTTTDWRDNWTVGYTPDLVAGVWVGNADNSPMEQVSGVTGAGPIWHDFMETALLGRPALAFRRPHGLMEAEVCALSGKLPTELCPHRSVEWFIEGEEPTAVDDWYQLLRTDGATGFLADESTPSERVVEEVYLVLPPELQSWAREQGIPAPPPAAADLAQVATGGAGEGVAPLAITSPDNGVVYRLSPAVPADAQQIRLTAVARVALARVTFIIDGRPVGTVSASPGGRSYELRWPLQGGQHQLVATGETAAGEEIRSQPVLFGVRSLD